MVKDVDIKKIKEAPYNPRLEMEPGSPEWEKLKRSIEDFGNVEPIVWNERTGHVVGGHQRLAVLKSMGYKKIPCSIVDLSIEDEKVLNIALNKIKGEWDYDKLEKILREYEYSMASASGFSEDELAILLSSNADLDDYSDDWWDEDFEDDFVGGSYVVTLVFENADYAIEWAESEGYKDQIRENSFTTVIRIEE